MLAQLNLTSPSGAKSPVGIVQVVRVDGVRRDDHRRSGRARQHDAQRLRGLALQLADQLQVRRLRADLVGKSGKIETEGRLKPGAAAYHHLLITLETQSKPTAPGEVVLSGPFREHS